MLHHLNYTDVYYVIYILNAKITKYVSYPANCVFLIVSWLESPISTKNRKLTLFILQIKVRDKMEIDVILFRPLIVTLVSTRFKIFVCELLKMGGGI